jgi:hypothetical protein
MLQHERVNPSLQTECDAHAVHWPATFHVSMESPAKKIGMIVMGTGCGSLSIRQQQGNLVLRIGADLKIGLRDGIGGDKKGIAGGSDFAG